jgi:arginine-tRNA-protein transferase
MVTGAMNSLELARMLAASQNLMPGEARECPYLPDRLARNAAFVASTLPPGTYQALMNLNFRRAGLMFYRPQCPACDECRMLRVSVESFRPSRAQRRCARRNADVRVSVSKPSPSTEKHHLFRRYLALRHSGPMTGSPEEYVEFLYVTAVQSLEVEYRLNDRLVGVGLVDHEPEAMSAVYFFFEPNEAPRSLGVFNVLTCVELCRGLGLAHLYLGYYVQGARKMAYKARYRPCDILGADLGWRSE